MYEDSRLTQQRFGAVFLTPSFKEDIPMVPVIPILFRIPLPGHFHMGVFQTPEIVLEEERPIGVIPFGHNMRIALIGRVPERITDEMLATTHSEYLLPFEH